MFILLVGVAEDPVLQYFFQKHYVAKDSQVLFINVNRIGRDIGIDKEGWSLPCGGRIKHHEVGAVYNRMLSRQTHQLQTYLSWLLDEQYPFVINRPKDTLTNFSKLWQLEYAKDFGFSIPDTEVKANGKVDMSRQDYIFKSISSVRSIVHKVADNPKRQVHEPVMFQRDRGRENIRVHVLGNRCYAQKICSQAVDYRYDLTTPIAREFSLPATLRLQCLALSKAVGLYFSGIDFIYQEDTFYFLEINPSPGYAYFEKQMIGSPISHQLFYTMKQTCQTG